MFESQVLKALFESLTPFIVAATFSRKILNTASKSSRGSRKLTQRVVRKMSRKKLTQVEPSKLNGVGLNGGTTTHIGRNGTCLAVPPGFGATCVV